MKITHILAPLIGVCIGSTAVAADYHLSLTDTGKREYYCQIMITLENRTAAPLKEISGYFYSYLDGDRVGRSKGTWFLNVPAGGSATSTFETPNAPCKDVDRYEFVIGACRLGETFEDTELCAGKISFTNPLAPAG